MHIYDKLGVKKYINAHDTYTVYGGSRMSEETLNSMREASEYFVDMHELQEAIGNRIAELTKNESAFVTNGAAGALQLAAAVCMTNGDPYRYSRLPAITEGTKNEIIVMRCHRNAYDKALSGAGATVIEIGDADETLNFDLEGCITPKTAAVFFFDNIAYRRAEMSLDKVIAIAHVHNIPVVVDAAAMLPPKSNLWKYTSMGADLAIFSGGKTLCGPQDSGIILGKKSLIDICRKFGAPEHGVCRASKCSRETMVGLLTAIEAFMQRDDDAEFDRLKKKLEPLEKAFVSIDNVSTEYIPYGPVGQYYPRLFVHFRKEGIAEFLTKEMLNEGIYIGLDVQNNTVYFSPLNLKETEVEITAKTAIEILNRG